MKGKVVVKNMFEGYARRWTCIPVNQQQTFSTSTKVMLDTATKEADKKAMSTSVETAGEEMTKKFVKEVSKANSKETNKNDQLLRSLYHTIVTWLPKTNMPRTLHEQVESFFIHCMTISPSVLLVMIVNRMLFNMM